MTDSSQMEPNGQDTLIRDRLAADRTSLANERTLLAYVRTAMALMVTSAGLIRFFDSFMLDVAGVALGVAAAATLIVGGWRYRTIRIHIRRSLQSAADRSSPG